MIVYCDADDCKWNEDGKCKGPVQPAGHTALYIRQKNAIQIKMNRTAARRLGYDCMDTDRPDLSESFGVVGQKAIKEKNISFSAEDGITIKISTKDGIHPLILDFLNHWKQMIVYLNNEENRYLAEFRDALLPKLMSGEIKIDESQE